MKRLLFLLLWGTAIVAGARAPDGSLSIILTPNNGVPAVVLPGGSFDVVLSGKADLRLVSASGNSVELAPTWTPMPGGRMVACCASPPAASPGVYALSASADGVTDVNGRAVFVRESIPDSYMIAHLADTHVGSLERKRTASDMFRDLIRVINKTDAALVFITGDLTDAGTPEQFQTFLQALDECILPTFVCPGARDAKDGTYARFFGPTTYRLKFGQDGYLVFDTKDPLPADENDSQDGDIEIYRREIRPCRWSIGVTYGYGPPDTGPVLGDRARLTLFVDAPLDRLLFGRWHRENKENEKTVPHTRTPITVTPAALDGALRLIDITPHTIAPRAVDHPVAVE